MKITQKKFIEQLSTRNSIFLGIVRRGLTDDEVLSALSDFLQGDKTSYEQRAATAKSNCLAFSDGSRLYFDNIAESKEYRQVNNILSFTEVYSDNSLKTLYYFVI